METISDPKVTVLMSVYNGEKHLRGAVESILGQTFRDFEFLIVNDASEDSSREIILSYNDPRIRLIDNKENLGLTRSLNRGIQLAKGEYIVRQDDDDISLPERLEKGVETFERHGNIGLTGSSYYQIDEDGREIYFCKADTRSEDLKRYLPKRNIFCHGSVMFRKSCIEKVGSYREKLELAQDYDLWLRIAEKFDITNIREPMYKSRIGLDSLTFAKSFRQGQYRSFVLKLSEERRNLGKDRLDDLTEEEIESILEELLP